MKKEDESVRNIPESVEQSAHQPLKRDKHEQDDHPTDTRKTQICVDPHDTHDNGRLDGSDDDVNQNVSKFIKAIEIVRQDVKDLSHAGVVEGRHRKTQNLLVD